MKGDRAKTEGPQFLSGWKEIANYLGKGVRTVQRYEWQLGLPVRRPAGKPRAAVVATKKEIDAWIAASPIREAFQLVRPAPELPAATAAAIQNGVVQMGKLRDQMKGLRVELRTALDSLRQSVEGLHGELVAEQWWKTIGSSQTVEEASRVQNIENFFASDVDIDIKGRKAS